MNFKNLCPI